MTNKFIFVGIVRTRSRFDGKFPHWLGMSMEISRLLQLSMGIYISCHISITV